MYASVRPVQEWAGTSDVCSGLGRKVIVCTAPMSVPFLKSQGNRKEAEQGCRCLDMGISNLTTQRACGRFWGSSILCGVVISHGLHM